MISPNPKSWTNTAEQQSVILQHALTSPASQTNLESDAVPGKNAIERTRNIVIVIVILKFAEAMYCVLPPAHEKNLMLIKNEIQSDKNKEAVAQLFPKQVRFCRKNKNICLRLLRFFLRRFYKTTIFN